MCSVCRWTQILRKRKRENAAILDELSRLDMQARKRRILREPVSATWGEVDHAQSALARQMEALAVQLRMRDEEAAKVTTVRYLEKIINGLSLKRYIFHSRG